jgi:hypothetical protein
MVIRVAAETPNLALAVGVTEARALAAIVGLGVAGVPSV